MRKRGLTLYMHRMKTWGLTLAIVAAAGFQAHTQAQSLGSANTFAVLGSSTVTNAGASSITGDLGVSTIGGTPTGFPPGTIAGVIHPGDPAAIQAHADAALAYGALAGAASPVNLTGMDLGGRTLKPGVYSFSSSAGLTGALVLDANDDPHAAFIFQIGSTLTTATNSSVVLVNQPVRANPNGSVFWQVGSSATLGTGTAFTGNLLAYTSITLTTGASIAGGRALAIHGAVTLDTNAVSNALGAILLGDINGNGKVGVDDAILALQFAVGLKTPTDTQLKAGDLNRDGKVSVSEATQILRAAVGLIKL